MRRTLNVEYLSENNPKDAMIIHMSDGVMTYHFKGKYWDGIKDRIIKRNKNVILLEFNDENEVIYKYNK